MHRIVSGTTHGLADTESFVGLLDRLPEHLPGVEGAFFRPGRELFVTRAPGRLDLMGGIADYSGALVLELPIAAAAHVALQLEEGDALTVVSLASDERAAPRRYEMSLADFVRAGEPVSYADARERFAADAARHWAAYVAGAFLVLMRERGYVFDRGARLLIRSEVPEGKGVSSSAALEVAVMRAVAAGYGINLSPRETALLCQRVENLVAGAPCGMMDQITAACGEADRLLALLCQPGELRESLRLPPELAVWGIDSGIRHSVGGADYGTVRTAAFMGYRIIADLAGLPCRATERAGAVEIDDPKWRGHLANITPAEFERSYARHLPARLPGAEFLARYRGITDPVTTVEPGRSYPVLAATQHPIYEHARVNDFASRLEARRDAAQAEHLGELMYQSHASYSACGLGSEGTDELVRLVREAGPAQMLYGAKITGGGSGGTVAVLGRRDAGEAVAKLASRYAERAGRQALVLSGSSPGACRFGHLVLR
ncbi:MAG: GHMP kinase [Acidobacteria bacterium]|nr:MAG: GHMP kinase [Acidobacteriota bacterium]